MPSALKSLKADLHSRRTSKSGSKPTPGPKPLSNGKNVTNSRFQTKKETPNQRAYRLRTETLLPELQSRHKAGGIIDRRIGENDPSLAPEDRMLQRYAIQGQKKRKADVFNLEEDAGVNEEELLTHGGRPLKDGNRRERLQMNDGENEGGGLFEKSGRGLEEAIDEATRRQEQTEDGEPARKKSRKEVMEEVIAKSKFHKNERQQARETYDDQREELDKALPSLLAALGRSANANDRNQDGRNADGKGQDLARKEDADKEYDQRVRQLIQDQRAAPTTRTKTDEEKAEEDAERLRKLEESRQKRMRGEEEDTDSEDHTEDLENREESLNGDDEDADEAVEFGLRAVAAKHPKRPDLDVEDEDEFVVDEDLIASGSDVDIDSSELDSENDGEDATEAKDFTQSHKLDEGDDDDDFLKDVLPEAPSTEGEGGKTNLAFTYPCPQSHKELLSVLEGVTDADIPVVIQRIRALYAPSLESGNKGKLATFGSALIDHLLHLTTRKPLVALTVIEQVIRHIHSLARSSPIEIGLAFRRHLYRIHEDANRASPGDDSWITPGDLTIFTAIGSIFPPSDHFHQVVTPALTLIARWLETATLSTPSHLRRSRIGAYLVALAIKWQKHSRRYIPEAIRFTYILLEQAANDDPSTIDDNAAKLIQQHMHNVWSMMDLWHDHSAFIEIFSPRASSALESLAKSPHSLINSTAASTFRRLKTLLSKSQLARRPLELHHHRPRPIRQQVPLFEDHFNPTKHYDPDPTRAENAKLRKAHKQEKKAAMRELRRDAEFVARKKLEDKKTQDRAYEEKFRRIIGGIQREEGEGANEYKRVKEARKRAKARS